MRDGSAADVGNLGRKMQIGLDASACPVASLCVKDSAMLQRSAKFEKFVDQQLAQYERDKQKTDNIEIKCVGLDLLGARLEDDEFGCHFDVLRFPERVAEAVDRLAETDRALLTRRFYALTKEGTAQNEMITVDWNLRAIGKSYGTFSKEYFVEWQETSDEMDHIHAFNSMVKRVLGRPLSVEKYEARDKFRRLAFERFDRFFRCRFSTPALYFSLRYVANVQLRSFEQFCIDRGSTSFKYNRYFADINRMHFHDESRHFASSLNFSLDLLDRITIPAERELIVAIVAGYMIDLINFTRTQSVTYDFTREALVGAIEGGHIRDFPLSIPQIEAIYREVRFDMEVEHKPIVTEMNRATCRRIRSYEEALGITRDTYERRGLALRNKVLTTVLDTLRTRAANKYNNNANYNKTLSSFAESYGWYERQLRTS